MAPPEEILRVAYARAMDALANPGPIEPEISKRIEIVTKSEQNRAAARIILACTLAKIHRPEIDIRKPYTEIGTADSFSGRTYDERYVTQFISEYYLPCNSTTAFLTPALRNRNTVLTPDINLVGRPPGVYLAMLQLLGDVYEDKISAEDLLVETIRRLALIRDQNRKQLENLVDALRDNEAGGIIPLSAEATVKLIEQHLSSPQSSRLPVLIVAAAYKAASQHLRERVLPLQAHNAADEQTGALGDIEITLLDDTKVITSYEMKTRRVTIDDLNRALQKINQLKQKIDNYVFITTDVIEEPVIRYAAELYAKTGGIEFVVLDCIGFLRHFLHLFHRLRIQFLEEYQTFLLKEPESAVRQSLKESFLVLRRAAESANIDSNSEALNQGE
jgi:DNA adenine methylase